MKEKAMSFVAKRPRTVVLGALLLTLLLIGGVGEAAAHNPAGHHVPGCDNGAEIVAEQNPNCHGE